MVKQRVAHIQKQIQAALDFLKHLNMTHTWQRWFDPGVQALPDMEAL